MNAPRRSNPSENNSCARLKQHWLFSRTEGKYKFHNLKLQTGNEQYILQEVKPWKLGMHAQLIHTHRQFKVQYSTYATQGLSVFAALLVLWITVNTNVERKMATEQGYSDTVYSRTISYQWMLHNIQSPHISHTHPMQHAKHEGERQSCGETSVCWSPHWNLKETCLYYRDA